MRKKEANFETWTFFKWVFKTFVAVMLITNTFNITIITQIKECKSAKTLHQLEGRFKKYDLVVCDEFGYVSCDKEAGERLFNHLSLRADTKSTIITTNLAFDRWGKIIKDKVLVKIGRASCRERV